MADALISPDQIAQARAAGYSDDEIVSHLASKSPEKFKAAKDAGYSAGEILAHLGGAAKTATQPTTAPASAPEVTADEPSIMQDIKAGVHHGINEMVRGTQSSRKNILGTDVSDAPVDPEYKPANVTNGSWNPLKWSPRQIPKLLAEQAPLAATSAVGAAAGDLLGPLGAITGGLAPLAVTSAGDNVKQRAVARTGNPNAVPNAEDKAIGMGTTMAAAIPGSIMHTPGLGNAVGAGLNGVGRVLTNLLTRGAVGAAGGVAQNAITQAGTKIGTDAPFDPSALPEAAVGGAASITPHLVPAVAAGSRALRMGKYNADPEAAANYATRLQNTNLDLNNIYEAAQAHNKVMADTHGELKAALDKVVQQKALSPEETNAVASIRRGDAITPTDMEHLSTATANTPDGANAHFLARALKVGQQAQDEGSFDPKTGWQGSATGGMKNVVRGVFNPWHIGGTMAGLGALAFGMPHVSGAVGGGLLGGLTVGLGGARLLDSITGGSRPAANFAKTFADHNAQLRQATNPPPQQPPPLPQAPNAPWGPRPPQPQQSVPQFNPAEAQRVAAGPQADANWKAMVQQAFGENEQHDANYKANVEQAFSENAARNAALLNATKQDNADFKVNVAQATSENKALDANFRANRAQADSENGTGNANFRVNQDQAVSENRDRDRAAAQEQQAQAKLANATLKAHATAAPAAAMKITKAKGGEVKATDPYAEAGSFQPVPDDRKVYHGLTPEQIGDKVARERPELPEMNRMGLRNAVTQTHAARDAVSADLVNQLPQHAGLLSELGSQLKEPGNSDIQYSRRAIKHYTDQMDPASAHIVKQRYTNERENLWPTAAEKRAASRKAKAKKEEK